MSSDKISASGLDFFPLTGERWDDLEKLFGPRGACSGCWCMWWRLTRAEFAAQSAAQHKEGLKHLTDSGVISGLLGYAGNEAVCWAAIAPQENTPSISRSPILKPIDDRPVWSFTCFFIAKTSRGQGVMHALITAGIEFARRNGAVIVEAYPLEPAQRRLSASDSYTGIASAFRKAGFVEVARRSARRPIMRYYPGGQSESI